MLTRLVGKRHHNVLFAAKALKKTQVLVGTGNASLSNLVRQQASNVAAGVSHLAQVGADGTGDQVEDGRLACAVRPNEGRDLAGVH